VLKFYLLNRAFVGRPERFALLLVTFCIAALSWRFVEQPFRTKPYRFGPRRTLAAAALAVAGFAAFAFGAPRAASKLRPLPPRVNSVLAYARYNPEISMRDGTCFLSSQSNGAHLFRKDICLAERSDKKNYLLLGDSHAAHFWPGLGALGTDINFLQATASGCSAVRHSTGEKRCTELLTFVFDDFLPAHHLDMILLSGRWVKADLPALEDTVRYMRPFADRVVVLGPIVEYDQSLPRLLANSIYRGEADLPRAHRLAEPLATDRLLAERLKSSPAEYQSVYEVICPRGECAVWAADDVPLQFDYGHLTAEGARLVLERLKPLLFESGRTGRAPNPNHAVRVGG